jgi:hypothetical protein
LKLAPFDLRGTKKGNGYLEIAIPILTVSEANGGQRKRTFQNGRVVYKSEHWTDKHKRHKEQKNAIFLMLSPLKDQISLPCKVTLTRYAPKELDKHDNLPYALKWILDAVCSVITGDYRPGRADANKQISVTYDQVPCRDYGLIIRIESNE